MVSAAFRNIRIVCIALAFCASFAAAASPFPDQARIRSDYHNGDFDKVIKALEAFQKSGRACTAADSLFLEKHLAVVYAANPVTRELGRYHMFKMLDLAPESDLLDMFVGEEVDGVFDKVRKEYALHAAAKKSAPAAKVAAAPVRVPAPAPAKAVPVKSSWDTAPVSARAAWEPAPAQAQGGWQTASLSYSPKASRAHAPVAAAKSSWEAGAVVPVKAAPKPAPARSWDDFSAPSSASARTTSTSGPAADIGSSRSGSSASSAFSSSSSGSSAGSAGSSDVPTAFRSSGSPAWKEPGLWIGGGAALAVVALTFFYSNSSDAPPAKTYVVPASAAR